MTTSGVLRSIADRNCSSTCTCPTIVYSFPSVAASPSARTRRSAAIRTVWAGQGNLPDALAQQRFRSPCGRRSRAVPLNYSGRPAHSALIWQAARIASASLEVHLDGEPGALMDPSSRVMETTNPKFSHAIRAKSVGEGVRHRVAGLPTLLGLLALQTLTCATVESRNLLRTTQCLRAHEGMKNRE